MFRNPFYEWQFQSWTLTIGVVVIAFCAIRLVGVVNTISVRLRLILEQLQNQNPPAPKPLPKPPQARPPVPPPVK